MAKYIPKKIVVSKGDGTTGEIPVASPESVENVAKRVEEVAKEAQTNLNTEKNTRASADSVLRSDLNTEITRRKASTRYPTARADVIDDHTLFYIDCAEFYNGISISKANDRGIQQMEVLTEGGPIYNTYYSAYTSGATAYYSNSALENISSRVATASLPNMLGFRANTAGNGDHARISEFTILFCAKIPTLNTALDKFELFSFGTNRRLVIEQRGWAGLRLLTPITAVDDSNYHVNVISPNADDMNHYVVPPYDSYAHFAVTYKVVAGDEEAGITMGVPYGYRIDTTWHMNGALVKSETIYDQFGTDVAGEEGAFDLCLPFIDGSSNVTFFNESSGDVADGGAGIKYFKILDYAMSDAEVQRYYANKKVLMDYSDMTDYDNIFDTIFSETRTSYVAICESNCDASEKTISTRKENFKLKDGAVVDVLFLNPDTLSDKKTLNIDNTGAKEIWVDLNLRADKPFDSHQTFVYNAKLDVYLIHDYYSSADSLRGFLSNGYVGIDEVTKALEERTYPLCTFAGSGNAMVEDVRILKQSADKTKSLIEVTFYMPMYSESTQYNFSDLFGIEGIFSANDIRLCNLFVGTPSNTGPSSCEPLVDGVSFSQMYGGFYISNGKTYSSSNTLSGTLRFWTDTDELKFI